MPYKINWENHSILTTWTGNATGEELLALINEVHSNHRFDDLNYSLHDFTACTGATFSTDSIELAAALDGAAAESNSHIKVGVALEREDVKAMVKFYIGTEMSLYPVRIFATAKEMSDWTVK